MSPLKGMGKQRQNSQPDLSLAVLAVNPAAEYVHRQWYKDDSCTAPEGISQATKEQPSSAAQYRKELLKRAE